MHIISAGKEEKVIVRYIYPGSVPSKCEISYGYLLAKFAINIKLSGPITCSVTPPKSPIMVTNERKTVIIENAPLERTFTITNHSGSEFRFNGYSS